jgi:hypothetical protein
VATVGRAGARAVKALAGIRAAEERLRRKKIVVLRARLVNLREEAGAIERQLRALGDNEITRNAGRIDWSALFQRLGPTFTAKEIAELTGVGPRHVAVITHKWRKEGRVVRVGHGQFRKTSGRRSK